MEFIVWVETRVAGKRLEIRKRPVVTVSTTS